MSISLLDFVPQTTDNFVFFSDDELDKVEAIINNDEGGLAGKAFDYASTVDISKEDGVDVLPPNFQRELAEQVEKAIPESNIAAKVSLYLKVENAILSTSIQVLDQRRETAIDGVLKQLAELFGGRVTKG